LNQLAKSGTNLHLLEPERIPEIHPEIEKKSKRSFNVSRSRLPGLIALVLLVYLAVIFSSQFGSIASMQREVGLLEVEIAELHKRNALLHVELEKVKSDAHIERAAREQLGLVKTGETRVIVNSGAGN
jgi:cell division protein DivIC